MALGDGDLVQAVLDDWRTAPISEPLRATLGFLKKLTLAPAELTPADADAVRDLGVSDAALADAIYVCTLFCIIDRMADTLNFYLPDQKGYNQDAASLLKRGYKM
jgi:alkylhydroperoxidase family enzyme